MTLLKHWLGTLIGLGATGAFAAVAYFRDVQDVGAAAGSGPGDSIAILVALFGLLLSVIIAVVEMREREADRRINKLTWQIKDLETRLSRNDRFEAVVATLDPELREFFRYSPERLLDALSAIPGSELLVGEKNIYRRLTEFVRQLKKNETLHACCGEKSWGIDEFNAYFDANIEASKIIEAKIFRAFRKWSAEVRDYAQKQKDAGITVFRPNGAKSAHTGQDVPATFGFAIFNSSTVVVHWGIGDKAKGRVLKDEILVGYFLRLYASIRDESVPF